MANPSDKDEKEKQDKRNQAISDLLYERQKQDWLQQRQAAHEHKAEVKAQRKEAKRQKSEAEFEEQLRRINQSGMSGIDSWENTTMRILSLFILKQESRTTPKIFQYLNSAVGYLWNKLKDNVAWDVKELLGDMHLKEKIFPPKVELEMGINDKGEFVFLSKIDNEPSSIYFHDSTELGKKMSTYYDKHIMRGLNTWLEKNDHEMKQEPNGAYKIYKKGSSTPITHDELKLLQAQDNLADSSYKNLSVSVKLPLTEEEKNNSNQASP